MGVYTRYKKSPDGLRQLVELLETTPSARKQKMIEIGMQEDPDFTNMALQYMLNFADVEKLPDMELAEVVSEAPARTTAFAFKNAEQGTKDRVLKCARPQIAAEVRDMFNMNADARAIGGAQSKLVEITRKLEKRGVVKTKRVPS